MSHLQQIAKITIATLNSIRNDEAFEHFWKTVNVKANKLDIDEPKLPRCRRRPKRHNDGYHPGDFHDTPEACYRQIYFEALDLIINCIEEGFDQPG